MYSLVLGKTTQPRGTRAEKSNLIQCHSIKGDNIAFVGVCLFRCRKLSLLSLYRKILFKEKFTNVSNCKPAAPGQCNRTAITEAAEATDVKEHKTKKGGGAEH